MSSEGGRVARALYGWVEDAVRSQVFGEEKPCEAGSSVPMTSTALLLTCSDAAALSCIGDAMRAGSMMETDTLSGSSSRRSASLIASNAACTDDSQSTTVMGFSAMSFSKRRSGDSARPGVDQRAWAGRVSG